MCVYIRLLLLHFYDAVWGRLAGGSSRRPGVTGGSFMPRHHHHHHWHGFDFTSISSFLLFVIWSSTSVTRVAKEVCLFFVFCFRFLSRCGRKRPAAAEGAVTDGCTLPAGHHGRHLEPEAKAARRRCLWGNNRWPLSLDVRASRGLLIFHREANKRMPSGWFVMDGKQMYSGQHSSDATEKEEEEDEMR